jgi:hypothetical protein
MVQQVFPFSTGCASFEKRNKFKNLLTCIANYSFTIFLECSLEIFARTSNSAFALLISALEFVCMIFFQN